VQATVINSLADHSATADKQSCTKSFFGMLPQLLPLRLITSTAQLLHCKSLCHVQEADSAYLGSHAKIVKQNFSLHQTLKARTNHQQ
jgi:uncharacterized protein VirK/YbjX